VKTGILGAVLLINAVCLFCAFNPWIADWRGPAVVVLVAEAASLLLIGVPLFGYHHFGQRKPASHSLGDTLRVIVDFLTGWA
jgi:hypothetical protein